MQLLRLENASVKSYWKIHCVWNIFAQSLEAPAAAAAVRHSLVCARPLQRRAHWQGLFQFFLI
jgi:hypothetical protein